MKKLFITLLLIVACIGSKAEESGNSYDFVHEGIMYKVIDEEQSLLAVVNSNPLSSEIVDSSEYTYETEPFRSFTGADYKGDVVIPDVVPYNGKEYHVSVIGYGAFANSKELKSVVFPDEEVSGHALEILPGAFFGCEETEFKSIGYVDISDIGRGAFAGCCAIRSFIIWGSLRNVGESAFEGCRSLEHIGVGLKTENDVRILPRAFMGCPYIFWIDFTAFEWDQMDGELKLPEMRGAFEQEVYEYCNLSTIQRDVYPLLEHAQPDWSLFKNRILYGGVKGDYVNKTGAPVYTGDAVESPGFEINVYDTEGRLVKTARDRVHTVALERGAYIATVIASDGERHSLKFMVE